MQFVASSFLKLVRGPLRCIKGLHPFAKLELPPFSSFAVHASLCSMLVPLRAFLLLPMTSPNWRFPELQSRTLRCTSAPIKLSK